MGVTLSVVYGCVPGACVALLRGRFALPIDAAVVAGALLLHGAAMRQRLRPLPPDYYWLGVNYMLERLRPGDTVWVEPHHHPIAAPDADYYWHGWEDVIVAALAYASIHPDRMPLEREGDLPLCRLEQGREPHLRFVSGGHDVRTMPAERACFERLYAAGRLSPIPMPYVYEVTARR